jgi:tRNA dimethylallyltransferase
VTADAPAHAAPPRVVALVGPTAAGKTEASVRIAEALDAEIVCIDSMVIYRGMDVGTAKPSVSERGRIRHHLLDLVEPSERFSVVRFQAEANEAIAAIRARRRLPFLVGGSGLYFRAVVDGLRFPGTDRRVRALLEAEAVPDPGRLHRRLAAVDPGAARRIEPSNVRRTVRALEVIALTGRPFSSFARDWTRYRRSAVAVAGVDVERAALYRRIEGRVHRMMPDLIRETAALLDAGFESFLTSSQAIGYAEAAACLSGGIGQEEAAARAIRRTKALARRQLAWFRRDPRIRWFRAGEEGAAGIVDDLRIHLLAAAGSRGRRTSAMEVG